MRHFIPLLTAALIAAPIVGAAAPKPTAPVPARVPARVPDLLKLPEAPGKRQVEASCTRCHGVDIIVSQPRSPDEWMEVVSIMVGNGVKLSDDEYNEVVDYLATNLARPDEQ